MPRSRRRPRNTVSWVGSKYAEAIAVVAKPLAVEPIPPETLRLLSALLISTIAPLIMPKVGDPDMAEVVVVDERVTVAPATIVLPEGAAQPVKTRVLTLQVETLVTQSVWRKAPEVPESSERISAKREAAPMNRTKFANRVSVIEAQFW